MAIKVAYLISVYKDPEHLKRLVAALSYGVEENVKFFVHVDAKVDETPFKDMVNNANVCFTPNRYWVQWGGYSQVLYQRELIRCALGNDTGEKQFYRLVIMTGQDYPLIPNKQMFDWYEGNPRKQMMLGINLTKNFPKKNERFTMYHFLRDTKFRTFLYQRIASAVCRKIMKYIPIRKKPYLLVDGEKWDVWMSSSYMSLTHECAEYVYQRMLQANIESYFKFSYVPEEMMIPTIIFNSKFRSEVSELPKEKFSGLISISMMEEFDYGNQIKVYDEEDYNSLLDCGKFFCRKVETGYSDRLMDMLDARNMNVGG